MSTLTRRTVWKNALQHSFRLNRQKKRMFQILISRSFDSWCHFISSQFLWQQMTPAKNKQIHRYTCALSSRSSTGTHTATTSYKKFSYLPTTKTIIITNFVFSHLHRFSRPFSVDSASFYFVQRLIPWLSLFIRFQIGITCDERAYSQFDVFNLANICGVVCFSSHFRPFIAPNTEYTVSVLKARSFEYNLAKLKFSEIFPVGLIEWALAHIVLCREFFSAVAIHTNSTADIDPVIITYGIKHKNAEVKHIVACADK